MQYYAEHKANGLGRCDQRDRRITFISVLGCFAVIRLVGLRIAMACSDGRIWAKFAVVNRVTSKEAFTVVANKLA